VPAQDEFTLIERIRRALPSRAGAAKGEVRLGIGDDAAVLRPRAGREFVISADQFLEDRHFLVRRHPADSVGYKALARAASDLAAMGAAPLYFFMTLALPAGRTGAWLDEFLRGMARAAREFKMILLGGDLAKQRTIAVSITVVGESFPGEAVTRSGARPGDAIFVSGTLGRAAMGLRMFLHRGRRAAERLSGVPGAAQDALRAHLYPQPRLALGQWLARKGLASSMIDISDGFSTDLNHLCVASGVGARVSIGRLPTTPTIALAVELGLDSFALGLHGGEDYELLFTVPARLCAKIPACFGKLWLTRVGEITRSRKLLLLSASGRTRPLLLRGWDHFQSRA
jgi:thiamine-monophosphate kinase